VPEQGNNLRVRYPEIAKELDQSDDDQVENFAYVIHASKLPVDVR